MNFKAPTLRWLVIAFIVVTLLLFLGVGIGFGVRVHRESQRTACALNLRSLSEVGTLYASTHAKQWPDERGGRLWLVFTQGTPPPIDPTNHAILACPVRGESLKEGETDYRGPRSAVSSLSFEDYLGADKVGNHGAKEGGNRMLRSGNILHYDLLDPAWVACASKLTP